MPEFLPTLLIGLVILFVASATQGLVGFGFGLVSVPILIIFLSPKIVVPIILLHGMLMELIILYEAWKWVEIRRILPLIVAGIIGMPFGTYLLKVLDVQTLNIIIGSVIVIFATALLAGLRVKIRSEKGTLIPVGLISGLLNGSTSLAGPPVILFFTNQGVKKEVFRANIIAYFVVLNIFTIPVYIYKDLITTEVIRYALFFLPALILGTFTGIRLTKKINERVFRNIALTVVILAGLVLLGKGLGK